MSKAEERGKTYALHKASEKLNDYYGNAMLSVVQFDGCDIKNAYIEGYHKAEKDLELTWEDIEKIVDLYDDVYCDFSIDGKGGKTNTEEHYQEVLKRFKDLKK